MANKTITDLQLVSAITTDLSIPADNGITSYRFTIAQLIAYLHLSEVSARTLTAAGTITGDDRVIFIDPTGGNITQPLPATAGITDGHTIFIKNIATNGNTVTIDGSGSELIDNALTIELGSSPMMESVRLYKLGTKWLIL